MRIAQVAPLYESVPPRLYGGTERVVSYLTEELVRQGHDVVLYASGDSHTAAQLVPVCGEALRLASCCDSLSHHFRMMELVLREIDSFDIVHYHIDYLHFPISRRQSVPSITTLHGRLDLPDLAPLYREYPDMPVVSISNAQRTPLPWINWQTTIYHGLPLELHGLNEKPEGYLAFLGRISPEKRADRAIEIARRSGLPLKIAAKVDKADREYFEEIIRPLLSEPHVEFIGEIGEMEKTEFLGNARALLFPIDWPEPFGLAMIESFACGTPVIAWRHGSVPEIVDPGTTGFTVDSIESAVAAVERVFSISREKCRQKFEERFSAGRMARDYVAAYGALASESYRTAEASVPA